MKRLLPVLLWGTLCLAQAGPPAPAKASEAEERELNTALAEAGSSPIEFIRALEKHLEKYPDSPRRLELERALVRAAMENKDDRRIILYGERVLARDQDDLQILERVARALLASDARDTSERALQYAHRYEELVRRMRSQPAPARVGPGQWQEELDRGLNRALVLEARAAGNLGRLDEAIALAGKSYQAYPTAEAAREIARWESRAGRDQDAVEHLADAFTIPDARATDEMRAKDRARMGELYRKLKGSEAGLGDLVLQAYDRTSALVAARQQRLRSEDPNAQASRVADFTLSSLDGAKLPLASLKGKTVVFDFWATWCGPCRQQHPLYEEVKQRFRDSPDVVFLSVNTDEDRTLVGPFLKTQKWDQKVYFEDGLSRALQISSIPTTVILDKHGAVVARMNGFLPDRFVDMLSERIHDALKD
ncbi:MAG TPA: TlpA disulfide reductase family protein [Bryobacteraceae bacterium]|nr:TlpA disulfide reductase family protein [Bryobacteraceae bacterium]